MKKKRFAVRQFCGREQRSDCYEVFDTTTGKAASFGYLKREATEIARKKNREESPS